MTSCLLKITNHFELFMTHKKMTPPLILQLCFSALPQKSYFCKRKMLKIGVLITLKNYSYYSTHTKVMKKNAFFYCIVLFTLTQYFCVTLLHFFILFFIILLVSKKGQIFKGKSWKKECILVYTLHRQVHRWNKLWG